MIFYFFFFAYNSTSHLNVDFASDFGHDYVGGRTGTLAFVLCRFLHSSKSESASPLTFSRPIFLL